MDIRTLIKLKAILAAGGSIETETATATGNPAAFYTDIAKALSALSVSFLPIQEGSGDPSASNIRNISGMTGMTVTANGTAIAISWQSQAGTVYGGSLDVLTGALTVEWEMVSGRWGDLESSGPNPETGYYSKALYFTNFPQKCVNEDDYGDKVVTNFCSKILWDTAGGTPEHFFILGSPHDSKKVYIYGDYDNDLVVQVAAKLATPLTFQLTAQEVSSIVGDNSISATGNSTLNVSYTRYKEYTASGAVASFITNSKLPMLVTTTITPVQDLHGQTSPWPAGGGKNKLPTILSSIKELNTAGSWSDNAYTYRGITVTVETDASGNVTGFKAQGTASGSSNMLMEIGRATYPAGEYVLNGSPVKYGCMLYDGTSSVKDEGSGAEFTLTEATEKSIKIRVASGTNLSTPVYFYPMIRLASVTDGTFAPYSNICPITGWTGAEVTGAGVNLWDEQWESGYYDTTTGQAKPLASAIRCKNRIRVLPSTAYYIVAPENIRALFYDENDGFISSPSAVKNTTVTTPSNAKYMRFFAASTYGTTYNNDISINYPSTDTSYHAYSGTTLSVTFPNGMTVYGGTLQINKDGTGEIAEGYVKIVYDGSEDEDWTANGSNGYFVRVDTIGCNTNFTPITNYLKGIAPGSGSSLLSWQCRLNATFVNFIAKPNMTIYDTLAKWKEYLSNNNLEVILKLATPASYTITAQQAGRLLSKQGQNNVWSSTGDTTVIYNKKA